MSTKTRKLLHSNELYIFIIICLFSILVQSRSGLFFTGNNIVDNIRSLCIPAMFCIGEMMILISGGVDVSFPAIASLSMYIACTRFETATSPVVFMIVAMLIGLVFGAINGFIIGKFKFNALIVTLGTSSICFGVMRGIFNSIEYPLAPALYRFGESKLFTVTNKASGLSSNMPVAIIFLFAFLFIGWFILNKTMLGRGIYAIGGDEKAAERAGFNVFWIKMFIYSFSGMMAGLIGVLRVSMLLAVHPNNLAGIEMTVIAACVLGGVRITGGKGTVLGATLGVILLTILSNSLILMGVSTKWQNVVIGIIIILGTASSAIQTKKDEKRLAIKLAET